MSESTILDRFRALLEQTAPFDRLPPEARAEVINAIVVDFLEEGEVVIEQGSMNHPGLYIIESGMVRLMDVDNQRLLDKCGEGDTFGSFGLIKGGAAIYEARATEPSVIALLSGEDFQRLYRTFPDFKSFFESDLKQYVRRMYSDVDVSGRHLLFNRTLKSFAHRRIVYCDRDSSAREIIGAMRAEEVEVVAVGSPDRVEGVVTMPGLLSAVSSPGSDLDMPAIRIMQQPQTISDSATLFDALAAMMKAGSKLLLITRDGTTEAPPVALLRDRDLAHFRGQDPVASMERIAAARHEDDLRDVRAETSEQLLNLYRQGARPEMLHALLTIVYDRMAIRILEIVERRLRRERPEEVVDLPWAWLRLGSGGRREMSMTSMQHNAFIYEDPSDEEEAQAASHYFNQLAEGVNNALERCGFEPSDVVARDPRWRRPARMWRQTYREWIHQSNEEAIRYIMPFFDLRGIYGYMPLLDNLTTDIVDALNVQEMDEGRDFMSMLAARAVEQGPPLSLMKRFVVERTGEHKRAFDIRERGIRHVVDAARVLAVDMRYLESKNTFDRLRAASKAYPEMTSIIDSALDAYRFLVDFRIESQLRAMDAGDKPTNHIDPTNLNRMQQNLLRSAFSSVAELQAAVADRYNVGRRGWLGGISFL